MKLSPSEITIGDRARKHVYDGISDLCASIRSVGQLHAIGVDSEYNLIFGARRLRACELLGIDVECRMIIDLDDAVRRLQAERDENGCRIDFTPTEAVELGKRLEALEAPKAANRMASGKPSSNLDEGGNGRTDEKVAAAVGMGKDTYRKAKAVVEAAAKPDAPESVKQAKEEMDRTRKVDPAYRALKRSLPPSNIEALAAVDTNDPAFIAEVNSNRPLNPPVKRVGVGVIRANEAVDRLSRIPHSDPLRDRGFQIVRAWLKEHAGRKPRSTDRSALISLEYVIEQKITSAINRLKRQNDDAIERLPNLAEQLRQLSVRLAEFADECDAKRAEVSQ